MNISINKSNTIASKEQFYAYFTESANSRFRASYGPYTCDTIEISYKEIVLRLLQNHTVFTFKSISNCIWSGRQFLHLSIYHKGHSSGIEYFYTFKPSLELKDQDQKSLYFYCLYSTIVLPLLIKQTNEL